MIYSYKYLSGHEIEKLHEYIESFFDEMFISTTKRFSKSLINKEFYSLTQKHSKLLLEPLKTIFVHFKALDPNLQKQIYLGFKSNNLIQDLCNGTEVPVTYKQLEKLSKPLSTALKAFFAGLYVDVINPEIFSSKRDHFTKFKQLNTQAEICPFCGLEPLLNEFDGRESNKKDDYDHWLSKGKYPFNSVNFRNLVPMCDKCNRRYKAQTDTIFVKNGKKTIRRKVFFPYDSSIAFNGISVSINGVVADLGIDDSWSVGLQSTSGNSVEIDSWNDIFNIKERYKNRIRTRYKNNWYEQIIKIYKRNMSKGNFDFSTFKQDVYDGLRPLNVQESSIIEKAYYDYFFSDVDCQKNLSETISI